jgi:hypothetical protein
MSDFINYLQNRIEQTKGELKDANDRLQQAASDRDMLTAELQGYEKTLSAEHRRQGIEVATVKSEAQESLALSDSATGEPEVNKAEFARQFICKRAESGVTPADILKGFQEAGVPITKPYIYSLVQRLQNRKPPAIRSRRGKWYPVSESEQSVSGTAEKVLP